MMPHPRIALFVLVAMAITAGPFAMNRVPATGQESAVTEENMRWKFGNPQDARWLARYDQKLAAIDDWWKAFDERKSDLDALFTGKKKWDLPTWMHEHLQSIDPRLMWEFGPGLEGGHRLVITPEVNRHLRPLVETILARAPELKGWEFYAFRLQEDADEANQMLEARGLRSLEGVKVRAAPAAHHTVDLTFYGEDFEGEEDREALNAAFVATEVILGEETLDIWIGVIDVVKGKPAPGAVSLDELAATVDRALAATRKKLPSKPAAQIPEEESKWTMWELKPEKEADYADQDDLFVGKSMLADMWIATHSGVDFFSERFSQHGETFCYVKLDGSQGLDEEGFEDKAAIEDALDEALRKEGLGAVVGGGTGLRYSYVDLALTDPAKAVPRIRATLSAGKVPKRSWILFFDEIYEHEWVGIYDDSPDPPR